MYNFINPLSDCVILCNFVRLLVKSQLENLRHLSWFPSPTQQAPDFSQGQLPVPPTIHSIPPGQGSSCLCGQEVTGKDLGNDVVYYGASQERGVEHGVGWDALHLSMAPEGPSLTTGTREGQTDVLVGESTFLFSNISHFLQALPVRPSCAPSTD